MTSIRVTYEGDRFVARPARSASTVQQVLLVSGFLSSLLYVATDLVSAARYPGYSYVNQAVSELSAIGAPTASFWSGMMVIYGVLITAFAVGVLRVAGQNRAMRVVGALLLVFVVSGVVWRFFPMHQRGADMSWQDIGHIVLAAVAVLLMLAWTAFGAFALGQRFRTYSFVTLFALLAGGVVSFALGDRIAAGEPTPWIGIIERVNVYGYLQWIAVFAIALVRRSRAVAATP